ncbi:MAG TPA: competence/damage-inducible protein A [Rhodospirillaceae bacterium]|nr:competence/damage-inducible protein A [Rhodospirillaceae bacterium]MAX63815.1 competence/damage-inducible protein A [Rhodospirillaceae bacterium]MBB57249.1 competence/damage-inducible protein A [Rhodospirillaceae bacterium]HAE02435.1 competence/damage-inducible protein A [Rhodospirillaceae bacterium]|tara:strand:+ start:59931 stop:60713 length:783 start_codon:yes stop_codon:yes gene_type:complete
MAPSASVTAALIIIGNEVLSGRTHDKNLPYIAEKLNGVGVRLTEARVIPDIPDIIIRTVRELSANFTYVFTTGGIGPTHDDITADCVAEAMGVSIDIDPEALRRLEIHYQNSGLEINEARLRMARIPAGATLIDNPISAAPGFRIGNVHVMAGVPKIMQAMLDGILPTLKGGRPMISITLRCGLPEGRIAEGLGALAKAYPDVDFGSYPAWTKTAFQVSLVVRGDDPDRVEHAAQALEGLIQDLGDRAERITASAPTASV